jgi:hypothetical protein
MSPTRKARPVSPGVAKGKPLEARHEVGPAQREQLAFLIVGGIALIEGIALILLARRKS